MNSLAYQELKQKAGAYTPSDLLNELGFISTLKIARQMLINDEWDASLQEYATELLMEIRCAYPKEWSADWKNDIFLGDACYITMKYNERYEAYKRAYEKVEQPPASLLISLASCYLSPDSPLTIETAENLARQALEKEMSIEGVILLRGIYGEKKDQANFAYWDQILKKLEETQIHNNNS